MITTKQSVTVWEKYLSGSEKSNLALLESDRDYWILATIRKMPALKNTGFWYILLLIQQFF